MKTRLLPASLILAACLACLAPAGEKNEDRKKPKSPSAKQQLLSNEDAIRAAAADFVADFNRGSAKDLAAHWTADGEYIDEEGQLFAGRESIQTEYEAFFKKYAGITMRITVDSVRMIGADTAIEDGRAVLGSHLAGPPSISKYVAVHVKQDGKWLMASVRDTRIETASHYGHIADLEWLIGNWSSEHEGVHLDVICRWIANKSFIERSHQVTEGGHVTSSGSQIIGWDPSAQVIKSWTFSSDGGHAVGVWSQHDSGWVVETAGVMSDGTPTTATNVLSRVSDRALSWKSVDRSAGGVALSDTDESLLKRK